jgi:predicted ATP-dependent serine protease
MNAPRKPMSDEAKAKIAESVRKSFEAKRLAKGDTISEAAKAIEVAPESVKMNDLSFDPDLFKCLLTHKPIDKLLSTEGGFPKATNFILVGDPGVGKSTVSMDILADLQNNGASVLFISGEMDRVDLYRYVQRYPKFGDIDILFLGEYVDENPKSIIETMLNRGYDVVLIDSFVEVQDTVAEASAMSGKKAEKWLVDLMRHHNMANNEANKWTSFLCIQQVTKEGVFLGSNKLKHNTTGMMELRFDKDGSRYVMFTKNRRGEVNIKMQFDLSSTGDVKYDLEGGDHEETIPTNEILPLDDSDSALARRVEILDTLFRSPKKDK